MKKIFYFLGLVAKIERLMLRIGKLRRSSGNVHAVNADVIKKVEKWIIDKRWNEDRSMLETAGDIGVSQEQLSLYFRVVIGKAFLHWRKEIRIEEAKNLLLKDKSVPMLIIAESVGINDKSNFRRQFKEVTGYTPAEWRLKH